MQHALDVGGSYAVAANISGLGFTHANFNLTNNPPTPVLTPPPRTTPFKPNNEIGCSVQQENAPPGTQIQQNLVSSSGILACTFSSEKVREILKDTLPIIASYMNSKGGNL